MELPDTGDVPQVAGETTVETTYSQNNKFRAIISKRPNSIFRIRREKWDLSDFEYIGYGFWTPDERGLTLTDTLENARKLACEKLAATIEDCVE